MRSYLLHDHRVTVTNGRSIPIPADCVLIRFAKDFDQTRFPLSKLVQIWNALPGIDPIKRFQSRPIAITRLWQALESLPLSSAATNTKQATLRALLQRPSGASMDQLMAATGWQRHSIRGTLAGVFRKRLGLEISSTVIGADRIYRILS